MRPRLAMLGVALAAVMLTVPSLASAAPKHNHHVTIGATPNPIAAGDGVLVYGQLRGTDITGQTITLYQHVIGSGGGYTAAATTTTDSFGFYKFTEPPGTVMSDENWFVRGPDASHSRTVRERVSALVSANASATATDTNHPIVFTGTVSPNHAGGRVFLQAQRGSSDEWATLQSGSLDANSNYSIPFRWRRPGERDVRVVFRSDARNLRGVSDPVSITVEQAQVPGFTISSSSPIAPEGSSVTISGVLDQAGTSTPEPNTVVQLWGRTADQRRFLVLADGMTGSDGSYSFTRPAVTTNTVYFVATLRVGHQRVRRTALLYQGVSDVVTMQPSALSGATGQTVTFSGTVMPDKAGHSIYLQQLGQDGDWHTVEVGTVRNNSTFEFAWVVGSLGTHTFRARITSDGRNVGSHSPSVDIVATTPPASSLPPAS
jgi:phage protein U